MKRKTTHAQNRQAKKQAKQAGFNKPGESRYARKKRYLAKNGLWGWEVPTPKPW